MSPTYTVFLKRSAEKEFHKLPAAVQRRVSEAFQVLALNPYSELLQVKKLKGSESLYRTRIGDYRIVYEIHGHRLTIVIIKIGHRSEVYR